MSRSSRATHGATSAHRRVEAPLWEEISLNYSSSTASALAGLATARASNGGRLVLWHGDSGTAKTHALRALSREWRDWCSPHFITDPEAFLGQSTAYLLDVLTSSDLEQDRSRDWKLLILEDAGELLTADAKARTGQALSRLLNVTDGLIGQGMNALALVTTNGPLKQLHPAVQWPGRCWSLVEFEALSTSEANDWLARAESSMRVSRPTSLAGLYALTRGEIVVEPESFGFGAA